MKNQSHHPRGMARAEQEAAAAVDDSDKEFSRAVEERTALQSAQATNNIQIKLERLARKDPKIRDLLDEFSALKATLDAVRVQSAESAAARDAAEQAHAGTTANLETAQAELVSARERIAALERDKQKLGEDLDAARSESAKARKDLEAALKANRK